MNNPFNHNYFIGYVNYVNPQYIKVHFPSSVLLNQFIFSGEEFNGGLIGNFVTIEGENVGFIGKISELNLPEKERLSLNEKAFQSSSFHPTAKVEILLSFDYYHSEKAIKSLNSFPNIGAKVYVCTRAFIQKYVKGFGQKSNKEDQEQLSISLGKLTTNKETAVDVSQQAMFSRHCAVVGTTGGGKSWTISKLIESMKDNQTKAILLDPTGEYENQTHDSFSVNTSIAVDSFFHYKKLTIEDLMFLVKPAGRVQAPKLIEAIRSLKAVELSIANYSGINSDNVTEGNLTKTGINRIIYGRFLHIHNSEIENGLLTFDIQKLPRQITNECVYLNSDTFGNESQNDVANCISMITRLSNILNTGIFKSAFGFDQTPNDENDLTSKIDSFLQDKSKYFLRIGFEKVGYELQGREIIANAIGKYLLQKARNNEFKENPTVFFMDEAHQFLNTKVTDENFQNFDLSSFDQIAKECRKYGLFLCLATQMPRDIPIGTLSQMGTFLVHRLINYNDKESIRQACSSANADLISFLPSLGEGEAMLTGVDFPMPISLKINPPRTPPDSNTPQFKRIVQQ